MWHLQYTGLIFLIKTKKKWRKNLSLYKKKMDTIPSPCPIHTSIHTLLFAKILKNHSMHSCTWLEVDHAFSIANSIVQNKNKKMISI